MGYEVTIKNVSGRHVAAVRDRRRWSDLGPKLIPLLDRVYLAAREDKIVQGGHNIFIFRDGSKDEVTVEVGVEVASPPGSVDGIQSVMTPSGEVAMVVHKGPYSGLGGACEAVIRWCKEHNRARANVWWEIYGDWHEDTARLETEVYYALLPEKG